MSHLTRIIRFVRHWHARIGVLAALLFLMLAVTGVMLNHTDGLRLAKRQVSAAWLMQWYGLEGERPEHGYLFQDGYFIGDHQRWLMDGKVLPADPEGVVGAVETGGMRYVATHNAIYIFQPAGALVEKLSGSALPDGGLENLGVKGELLAVKTPDGVFLTEDALEWSASAPEPAGDSAVPPMSVVWAAMQPLSGSQRAEAATALAPGLPLERVVLDIHSGRILGQYGPWVMDLAALILVVLSFSGVWIYLRSIRKR